MAIIPIRVESEEIHIRADRRLAFEVVAGFGAAHGESGASSKVLRDEGQRKLVECRTPVKGLFGRTKVYRSVEWVTLHEPETIDFEGVEGPLQLLQDRFLLEDVEGCTDIKT